MILNPQQTSILSDALNNLLNFIHPENRGPYLDALTWASDRSSYNIDTVTALYEQINVSTMIEVNTQRDLSTCRTDCNMVADSLFFLLGILRIIPEKYRCDQHDVMNLYQLFHTAKNYRIV